MNFNNQRMAEQQQKRNFLIKSRANHMESKQPKKTEMSTKINNKNTKNNRAVLLQRKIEIIETMKMNVYMKEQRKVSMKKGVKLTDKYKTLEKRAKNK